MARGSLVPVVVLIGLLSVLSFPVCGQPPANRSKPLVVITALSAPSHETVAEELARTVTANIDLIMSLSGSVRVQRADFLSPTTALDRAIRYYEQTEAQIAVYGSVTPKTDGGYDISLELWKASVPQGRPVAFRKSIGSVLSSFEASDQLSLEVGSNVVGRQLSEGTLVVENLGDIKQYSVYADGQLLGRNKPSFRVLTGKRKIVVAKPGEVGDVPIQSFGIEITEGATSVVRLTPSEAAKLPPAKRPKGVDSSQPPATRTTGALIVRAYQAGTFYLDSKAQFHLPSGGVARLRDIPARQHKALMRFDSGKAEEHPVTIVGENTVTVFFGKAPFRPEMINYKGPLQRIVFQNKVYRPGFFLDYPGLIGEISKYPELPKNIRDAVGTRNEKRVQILRSERIWTSVFWGGAAALALAIIVNSSTAGQGPTSPAVQGLFFTGTVLTSVGGIYSYYEYHRMNEAVRGLVEHWNSLSAAAK